MGGFEQHVATTKATTKDAHRLRLTGAEVRVLSGPDTGVAIPVSAGGIVVGKGESCDLRLRDKMISRRHVQLRAEQKGVRVVDLDSLNGTEFAGAQIRELVLQQDAVLSIGETSLAVRLLSEPLDLDLSSSNEFGEAIAQSSAMRHVFALLERAAESDVTVLLEGDSGTGKDVLARAIHQQSARSDEPFVVLDCGAIPENLVESELFGHEKGAFSGAIANRMGAFEQAHGGTLFLDEIGELPLTSQPKLLRALESRSFRRVGGAETINVDVRLVAATNRRLREAVRRKEFRDDLFYRIAVVHVLVPRLRDRPDDIAPLAELFLRRATGQQQIQLPAELTRLLVAYSWPGNARELRNVVERFATFERTDAKILFSHRSEPPPDIGDAPFAAYEELPYHDAKQRLMEAFHLAILPQAVEQAGGSVPQAAKQLGIPKASLYRMLQQLRQTEPESRR